MPHENGRGSDLPGGLNLSYTQVQLAPDEDSFGGGGPSEEDALRRLPDRITALGTAYLEIVDREGEFTKPEAGYEPRSLRGTTCEGCLFYEGDQFGGDCDLVKGQVDAGAVCNLFIESPTANGKQ